MWELVDTKDRGAMGSEEHVKELLYHSATGDGSTNAYILPISSNHRSNLLLEGRILWGISASS